MVSVALTCRVLLVVVLVWSVTGKLAPSGFRATVDMLRQLGPVPATRSVACALIIAEFAVAVLVAVPRTAVVGAPAAVTLFVILTGAVSWVLARRINVRCACFGAAGRTLNTTHLIRNLALLAVAGCACLATHLPRAPEAISISTALGVFLALVLVRLDDVIFLFSAPTRP